MEADIKFGENRSTNDDKSQKRSSVGFHAHRRVDDMRHSSLYYLRARVGSQPETFHKSGGSHGRSDYHHELAEDVNRRGLSTIIIGILHTQSARRAKIAFLLAAELARILWSSRLHRSTLDSMPCICLSGNHAMDQKTPR